MTSWIPKTYTESREAFLSQSRQLSLTVTSWKHPETGPEGEELYIDVAEGGNPGSTKGLVHLIGTHGVEGYAGAGIQNQILSELKEGTGELPKLLFIHPVNPYGMAWLRRVNHNNVDLNRNYRSQNFAAPDSKVYSDLYSFLNPKKTSDFFWSWAQVAKSYLKYGSQPMVNGIAQGQYDYPEGLFYGGAETEPEIHFLKSVFLKWAQGLETVWALEMHTGLGDWAKDMLLADTEEGSPAHQLMEKVYDYPMSFGGKADNSYNMFGKFSDALREATKADLYYTIEEFGVYPMRETILAARSENHFHQHSKNAKNMEAPEKLRFKETFCADSELWRKTVIETGAARYRKALEHLAGVMDS